MKRTDAAFSLTEVLVVISVILILASFFVTATGELYGRAIQLKCAGNLAQLGNACRMFENENQRLPTAFANAVEGRRAASLVRRAGHVPGRPGGPGMPAWQRRGAGRHHG